MKFPSLNNGTAFSDFPLVIKFNDLFAALSPRDQLALKALSGFLLPIVVIFGLLIPAAQFMDEALVRFHDAKTDYHWMNANRSAVTTNTSTAARDPEQSIFGIANSTSKGYQINFKRYEPVGEQALSLWIEGASFNNVVLWLERLDKRHSITVKEIAVERQETEGIVDVRLILQG